MYTDKDLYQIGIRALMSNNIKEIYNALQILTNYMNPDDKKSAESITQLKYPNPVYVKVENLSIEEAITDLKDYCKCLQDKIYGISNDVIYELQKHENKFHNELILKNKKQEIKVSDLLKAISYSLDFLHKVAGIDVETQKQQILVLKCLDRFFNNQHEDVDIYTNIGLVVEVFSEILKFLHPEQKEQISNETTCISLAIDFLTHKENT